MNNSERISRGQDAEKLLDHPLLIETLQILEDGAMQRLRAVDVNDAKKLQTLVMALQAVNGFKGRLKAVAIEGREALDKEDRAAEGPIIRRFVSKFT